MENSNIRIMRLAKGRLNQTKYLFQYDYGQRLVFTDVELPDAYEVHFSNQEHGQSKTMIGDSTGVDIPDEYLLSGEDIYVWLYLHNGLTDGETEYMGVINVKKRAQPTDDVPTPEQQSVIDQTIAALNNSIEEIPQVIDTALQEAKESGEFKGDPGAPGPDGFSPSASVSKVGRTTTITVTDKTGTTTAQVLDGDDGGFSPIANVNKSGDTATITITDKTGTTTAQINDGQDGADGQDGFSPVASASKSGNVTTISITDRTGTTTTEIVDGIDGLDGFSPIASVSKSGSTTTISITDKNGTTTAEVTDGEPDPVVIASAVDDWLDDHPEATTTVEDGAISRAKLNADLQAKTDSIPETNNILDEYVYIRTDGNKKNTFTAGEMENAGIFSVVVPQTLSESTEYVVFQEDLCPPLDAYHASSVMYSKNVGNALVVNGTAQTTVWYYGRFDQTDTYSPTSAIALGDTVYLLATASGSFTPAQGETEMVKLFMNNYDSGGTNRAQINGIMTSSDTVKILSSTMPSDISKISVWIRLAPGTYEDFTIRWMAYKNETVQEYDISNGLVLKDSEAGTNGLTMLPVDGYMETFVNTKEYIDKYPYYITPKMFGAVGDGITDDSMAVQEAFDYAAQHKQPLYISDGVYYIHEVELRNGYTYNVFGSVVPRPDWNVAPNKGLYIKKDTCGFIGIAANNSTSFDAFPKVRIFMSDVTIKGENSTTGYPTVFKDIVFTDSTFDNINASYLRCFIDGAVIGNSLITNCKLLAVHNSVFKSWGCTYGIHGDPDFTDARICHNYFSGMVKGLGNLYFPTVFDTPTALYNNFFSHNFVGNMWAVVGVTSTTTNKVRLNGWNSDHNIYSFVPYFGWNKIPNSEEPIVLELCNFHADSIWYASARAIIDNPEGRAYFDDYSNEPRITGDAIHFLSGAEFSYVNVTDIILRMSDTLLEDVVSLHAVNLLTVNSYASAQTDEERIFELNCVAHAFDTKIPLEDYTEYADIYVFDNIPSWNNRTVNSLPTIQDSNYRYVLEKQTCYYNNKLYTCLNNTWVESAGTVEDGSVTLAKLDPDLSSNIVIYEASEGKHTFTAQEMTSAGDFKISIPAQTGTDYEYVSYLPDLIPPYDAYSYPGVVYSKPVGNVLTLNGTRSSDVDYYGKYNDSWNVSPNYTINSGDKVTLFVHFDGTVEQDVGATQTIVVWMNLNYSGVTSTQKYIVLAPGVHYGTVTATAAADVTTMNLTVTIKPGTYTNCKLCWAAVKTDDVSLVDATSGITLSDSTTGKNGITMIPINGSMITMANTKEYVDNHLPDDVITEDDLDYITPEMFGAVGDGVADDSVAMQAAMNYSALHHKPINVSKGVYKIGDINLYNGNSYEIYGSFYAETPNWNGKPVTGLYIKNDCAAGFVGVRLSEEYTASSLPVIKFVIRDTTVKGENGSNYPTFMKDVSLTNSRFLHVGAHYLSCFIFGMIMGSTLISDCELEEITECAFRGWSNHYGSNTAAFTDSRIINNQFSGMTKGLGSLFYPTVFEGYNFADNFFYGNFIANFWAVIETPIGLIDSFISNNNIYTFTPYFALYRGETPSDIMLSASNIANDQIWYAGVEPLTNTAEGKMYFDDFNGDTRLTDEHIHFYNFDAVRSSNIRDVITRWSEPLLKDVIKMRYTTFTRAFSYCVYPSGTTEPAEEAEAAANAFVTKFLASDYNDNMDAYIGSKIMALDGRVALTLPTIEDSTYRYVLDGQTCYYNNKLLTCRGTNWYDAMGNIVS